MRGVVLALCVAACVTSPPPPPNERLAGCWIDRGQNRTVTMRWLRAEAPNILTGDLLEYGRTGGVSRRARYTLAAADEGGWSLCEFSTAGGMASCYPVAEGESGTLENGIVFIDRHGEELRITIASTDTPNRVVFNGRADGCD